MAKNKENENKREEMKCMTNKNFMTAQDVADALGVSKSYAYKLVRQLNDEMEALGYITVRAEWMRITFVKSMLQRIRERKWLNGCIQR